jgi:acyl carrier protein
VEPVPQAVKRLVAEICGVDAATVRDDGKLVEYGMDSVRAMDLIVALEHAFSIEIPEDDSFGLTTVEDVIAYVRGRLPA